MSDEAKAKTKETMQYVKRELATYFRTVAAMLEHDAMDIEFYNSSATNDPLVPQSQFASMKGNYLGVDHGMVFNAWQSMGWNPQVVWADTLPRPPEGPYGKRQP
jgi:beta-lactamase class D